MRYDKTGIGQVYGQLSAIKNLISKENNILNRFAI